MHSEDGCDERCTGEHVTLIGGPLDGWDVEDRATGVAHVVDGWAERACYAPPEGDLYADRWVFEGVMP